MAVVLVFLPQSYILVWNRCLNRPRHFIPFIQLILSLNFCSQVLF
jgi:hypothetical protein